MTSSFIPLAVSQFELFGTAHFAAIALTFATAICLIFYLRSNKSSRIESIIRVSLAGLLLTAVALDPVLTILRFGNTATGWELVEHCSLTFYLCDVVSIILAIALIRQANGWQRSVTFGD
ncbi:MAG: hypothetical protein ABGY95_05970 [Rubritalea sp.]|uniref:TMEM164 family acyltransferase n=1 Tax=Rubritalea sp. TaxID=2109375 RepID=UPI0032427FEC